MNRVQMLTKDLKLSTIFYLTVKDNVPIVPLKNRKFPAWYYHNLISLVEDKEQAWKDYKFNNLLTDFNSIKNILICINL